MSAPTPVSRASPAFLPCSSSLQVPKSPWGGTLGRGPAAVQPGSREGPGALRPQTRRPGEDPSWKEEVEPQMHFERLRLCWSGRGVGGFQVGIGPRGLKGVPLPPLLGGGRDPVGGWGEGRRRLESAWGGREKGPNHSDGVVGCWSGGGPERLWRWGRAAARG